MRAGLLRAVRACAMALAAVALAACAQTRTVAEVGIGTAAYQPKPAKPYAVLYKPYAEMATVAYTNQDYLDTAACPDAAKLRASGDPDNKTYADMVDDLTNAHWSCHFGHVGPYGCKPVTRRCVVGHEYHVWRRGRCGEAVIAFRGTDANEIGDWLTNLRWFIASPLFDQYDQVQKAVPDIIDKVNGEGCRPRLIVATGHSLGGGLAQHAAYADKRIEYVYAFDPSPVTAFFGVPLPARSAATEHLGIDRVYEAGEFLSLPRYIVSGAFPSSQCRPRVRIVRFAVVKTPSIIERHRIAGLTAGLADLSAHAGHVKVPLGFAHARTCDFVQPDKYGD
jgi:hypothetical protein